MDVVRVADGTSANRTKVAEVSGPKEGDGASTVLLAFELAIRPRAII